MSKERLFEYAKSVFPYFEQSKSRRLTNGELYRMGFHTTSPKLRTLVSAGLIKSYRSNGNREGAVYNVFEITDNLARQLGVDISDFERREDILPDNLSKEVRKFIETTGSASRQDIQDIFGLNNIQALSILNDIKPPYRTVTGIKGKVRTATKYSFRPFIIPEEVKALCERIQNLNAGTLNRVWEKQKQFGSLTIEDIRKETGFTAMASNLKYFSALQMLKRKGN